MTDNVTDISPAPAKRARKAPAKRSAAKIPASAPKPRDRQPKMTPARAEAEGLDLIPVEWEGLTFEIIADPDAWDFWTVTAPLSQNNIPGALLGLLGPQQALKLRLSRPNLTSVEGRSLFDAINEQLGLHATGN